MEFLRFGSSIPGSYWGCCAACIIQNFKVDPDEKASIQVVSGDGGQPIEGKFLGKTYREIFEARMALGTFNDQVMPNHAFFAILTDWQINSEIGGKWLKILKEHGFEFLRTVDNSVYSGPSLYNEVKVHDDDYEHWDDDEQESRNNYIFALFRNIGNGKTSDPFLPPQAWLDLDGGVTEVSSMLDYDKIQQLQQSRDTLHLEQWGKITPVTFYKEKELEDAGVPVWYAGVRSKFKQETKQNREINLKAESGGAKKAAPFSAAI